MNFEIYKIVLGQIARHFISIAAAGLGAYGVNEAQQGQLVEASVWIAVAIGVFLFSQGWAYISKRLAFLTPVDDEEEDQ